MKRNEYVVQIGSAFVSGHDEDEARPTWVNLSLDSPETAVAFKRTQARDIAKRFGGKVLTRTTTVSVN